MLNSYAFAEVLYNRLKGVGRVVRRGEEEGGERNFGARRGAGEEGGMRNTNTDTQYGIRNTEYGEGMSDERGGLMRGAAEW